MSWKLGDKVRLKGTYHHYNSYRDIVNSDATPEAEFNKWCKEHKTRKGQIVTITTIETDDLKHKHYWFNNIRFGNFADEDIEPPTPNRLEILNQKLGGSK